VDFLLAIYADRNTCKPFLGPGRVGHVVRVTSNPHPTVVNEFTDGGKFEHEDCGPASLQSWLRDQTNVRTLRNTALLNVLDWCGVSLPMGRGEADMPLGVLISGPAGTEDALLPVAAALEHLLAQG
jgi:Asp-tRNA(Asn)/Glu-tRNA(Gln) amidotransferase A subunit family amidase